MTLNWRPLRKRLIVAAVVCLALGAFAAAWVSVRLTDIFEAREQVAASRVLGRAYPLRDGVPGSSKELSVRLDRLGYRHVNGRASEPGSYSGAGDTVVASLRGFHDPSGDHPAVIVRVTFGEGRIAGVSSPGTLLEPETIAAFQGPNLEEREIIQLADCPKQLIDAILAAEDRRFFIHPGIDPGGIARALWTDLASASLAQGGSTLTQQLAKNLYFSGERTFSRKAAEAFAALVLEARYPKERILRAYINEVYLGQRGAASVSGFGRGARHYFGKSVRDLTLPESALLAGLIRAPGLYNPWLHADRARERRDAVLRAMEDTGSITAAQQRDAEREPVRVQRAKPGSTARTSYTAEMIRQDLAAKYGAEFWRRGILVHTSIDPLYQAAAEQAVTSQLRQIERAYRTLRPGRDGRSLQAALISVDLEDGAIVAMVGGRDFGASQFNRSTSAKRQPGSLFKPIVYLAGLTADGESEGSGGDGGSRPGDGDTQPRPTSDRRFDDQIVRGPGLDEGVIRAPEIAPAARIEPARWNRSHDGRGAGETRAAKKRHRFHWWWQKRDPDEPDEEPPPDEPLENVPTLPFTAATILMDEPYEIQAGGRTWAPQNDDEIFRGPVTVQRALEESLNVPTARAAAAIGLPRIVATARAIGITSALPAVPSLALGAAEMTPFEMATAFTTIASSGRHRELGFVIGIENGDSTLAKRPSTPVAGAAPGETRSASQVIPEESAHLMTALLEGVLDRGTGRSARDLGFSGVAAGKTGTSDEGRDLWFCGYTPKVLTLVWVGFDDNAPTHLTGARAALPIWVDYMEKVGADGRAPFGGDADLVWSNIDTATGGLSLGRCPDQRLAPFIPGTEPTEECAEHRSFWSRWFE